MDKIKLAETFAEIEQWDVANTGHLDRLQQLARNTYDTVVIAMDKRREEIAAPKPAEQQVTATTATVETATPEKKKRIRPSRAKPKPDAASPVEPPAEEKPAEPEKPALVLTDDERDWYNGLGGAFSGCEDRDSLDAEGERLMDPWQGKVSDAAWQAAVDLYQEHVERLTPEIAT